MLFSASSTLLLALLAPTAGTSVADLSPKLVAIAKTLRLHEHDAANPFSSKEARLEFPAEEGFKAWLDPSSAGNSNPLLMFQQEHSTLGFRISGDSVTLLTPGEEMIQEEASIEDVAAQAPEGVIYEQMINAMFSQIAEVRLHGIYSAYHPGYGFPRWVGEQYALAAGPLTVGVPAGTAFAADAAVARVFYDEGDDVEAVQRLVMEREPVNIEMSHSYSKEKLERMFGWREGAYGKLYANKTVPPNIATLNRTPVDRAHGRLPSFGTEADRVWILNAIGYAFDSGKQPDMKYYLQMEQGPREDALRTQYRKVFNKIFYAAMEAKVSVIFLSKFGTNNFAGRYPNGGGDGIYKRVWRPAFEESFKAWVDALKRAGLQQIAWMDQNGDDMLWLRGQVSGKLARDPVVVGFFPENLNKTEFPSNKVMIVNAWDPWSLAGNGNGNDNSLDGFIGRRTAIAALSWPGTNPFLLQNAVSTPSVPSDVGAAAAEDEAAAAAEDAAAAAAEDAAAAAPVSEEGTRRIFLSPPATRFGDTRDTEEAPVVELERLGLNEKDV